jgi:hypothetical protein
MKPANRPIVSTARVALGNKDGIVMMDDLAPNAWPNCDAHRLEVRGFWEARMTC